MQRNSQKESRAMSQASGEIIQIVKVRINIIISYIRLYIHHHIDLKHLLTCILQPVCIRQFGVFLVGGCQHHSAMLSHPPTWLGKSLSASKPRQVELGGNPPNSPWGHVSVPLTHPKKNVEN